MSSSHPKNPWAEINGGLRGSALLCGGAVLMALATLQNFVASSLVAGAASTQHMLVISSWLSWIAALVLLAAGFIWVGVQPFFSRFGLVVGGFHLVNGVFLMGILFAGIAPPVPNVVLSIGRTLLLLFFALLEKNHLRPFNVGAMVTVALLQFLKISLRIMEVLPSFGEVGDAGLDTLVLLLLASAIFLIGRDIKHAENKWAIELASTRASGFGDFNNPEHQWNQPKD